MIKVIARARFGYAEVVSHTGKDACRVGGDWQDVTNDTQPGE